MKYKIIHIVHTIERRAGGPSRSVPGLVRALKLSGIDAEIICGYEGDATVEANDDLCPVRFLDFRRQGGAYQKARLVLEEVKNVIEAYDGKVILHLHGLWVPTVHLSAKYARENNIQYVISLRGMFTSWALNFKKFKKRIALLLYQKKDLACASFIHSTAKNETDDALRFGVKNPIIEIPNGIDVSEITFTVRDYDEPRRILFLSRIQKKKGLELLLRSWCKLERNGWELLIVGPDEAGHKAELQRYIADHKLSDSVTFMEPVDGLEKWGLYQSADFFVLPSHTENFGIVVAEALACGTPVLTTRGTPWKEIEDFDCGWWIELSEDNLRKTMEEAMNTSRSELRKKGERGKKLIVESYGWGGIAEKFKLEYEKLL